MHEDHQIMDRFVRLVAAKLGVKMFGNPGRQMTSSTAS